MNKAPKFWNDQTILFSALSTALLPLSWIWRGVTAARLAWIKPEKASFLLFASAIFRLAALEKPPLPLIYANFLEAMAILSAF